MEKVEGNLWRRQEKDGQFRYLYRRLLQAKTKDKKYRDYRKTLGDNLEKALAEKNRLDDYFTAQFSGEKPSTLGEFFDWYVRYLRDERKLLGYQTPVGHLKAFVKHKGAQIELAKITRADVETFLHACKGRISQVTVDNHHRSIRRMFNVAIQRGYLEKNPAIGIRVEKPRLLEPVLPSVDEVKRLLDYLKHKRPSLYPIVVTLIYTGARLGEVLSLDWSRVDFIGGTLVLVRRKVNDLHRLPMAKTLNETLNILWMEAGMPKEGFVFLGKTSNQRDRHCLSRSFKKSAKAVGLPWITLKTFRKLAATWVAQSTHDVRAAQKLLGHTNIRTTELYLGEGSESRDMAVKAIEDKLGHGGDEQGKVTKFVA
mgnify:FL=1